MVHRAVNLGLRGFQFLCILIVMALVGNMIASAFAGNPSLINYDIFVATLAMLSLFYLILISFKSSFTGHGGIPFVLDLINVLLLFCAAVAMAAELGVHSCSNREYTESNHITNGSHDTEGRCREAQATTAFLWFAFAAWTVSLFFSFQDARSGGANLKPSFGRGNRPMSQV